MQLQWYLVYLVPYIGHLYWVFVFGYWYFVFRIDVVFGILYLGLGIWYLVLVVANACGTNHVSCSHPCTAQ
jgi:hypothetical protein